MFRVVVAVITFCLCTICLAEEYQLGPDSQVQENVPKGAITKHHWVSKIFDGTERDYWIYVPAQYDPAAPASLMIYNDGQAFMAPEGDIRAPFVMDNLIYRREIPVMIGVFINPGRHPDQPEPHPGQLGGSRHKPAY